MPLINESFFDPPLLVTTRMKATGAFSITKGDEVKAPFGGIDPQAIRYDELPKNLPVVRVAHSGGRHNATPQPYSPWWATMEAFDQLILFARAAKQDVQEMFRRVQAVIPDFGPSNYIFSGTLREPVSCFRGRSRPIWLYKKSSGRADKDSYQATYLSQPPLLPGTAKASYDTQVPRVEQLYIPGLSRWDYPSTEPDRFEKTYQSAFNIDRQMPFTQFVLERRRVLKV